MERVTERVMSTKRKSGERFTHCYGILATSEVVDPENPENYSKHGFKHARFESRRYVVVTVYVPAGILKAVVCEEGGRGKPTTLRVVAGPGKVYEVVETAEQVGKQVGKQYVRIVSKKRVVYYEESGFKAKVKEEPLEESTICSHKPVIRIYKGEWYVTITGDTPCIVDVLRKLKCMWVKRTWRLPLDKFPELVRELEERAEYIVIEALPRDIQLLRDLYKRYGGRAKLYNERGYIFPYYYFAKSEQDYPKKHAALKKRINRLVQAGYVRIVEGKGTRKPIVKYIEVTEKGVELLKKLDTLVYKTQ